MPEMGLELPAKDQYISSLSALMANTTPSLSSNEDDIEPAATSGISDFLGMLETIPGVNLSPADKQTLRGGHLEISEIGVMTDLFKVDDLTVSAACTFTRPLSLASTGALLKLYKEKGIIDYSVEDPFTIPQRLDSAVAIRKVVGGRAAEVRLNIDGNARFMGGSLLVGNRIPDETGMTTEGSIDFSPTGELKRPSGNLETHGIKHINVARVISSLTDHETTNLTPRQLLKNASI